MGETTRIAKPEDGSGDDNPLIPDKIEKDLKKSKFGRWILWACSLVLVPVLGWAGNEVLAISASFEALKETVKDLQRDKTSNDALWKSLGDLRNQLIEVRIQHETLARLCEKEFEKSVFDRYIEFKMVQEMHATGRKPKSDLPDLQLPPPTPLPTPLPIPKSNQKSNPFLDRPDLKPLDPDQYRLEQEQKFPRPDLRQQQQQQK